MFQQYTPQIANYLANAIGIDPQKIELESKMTLQTSTLNIFFLNEGKRIGHWMIGEDPINKFEQFIFQMPAVYGGKLYAPFSLLIPEDLAISSAVLTYHIQEHPELVEVLGELMQKRIARGLISYANEPIITLSQIAGLEARMRFIIGPTSQNHLCIPVENNDLVYVPEAKEQKDQGHSCVHGETAPLNLFNVKPHDAKPINIVYIQLGTQLYNNGERYLENLLENTPVAADGLGLQVVHRDFPTVPYWASIELKTPYNPSTTITFFDPKIKGNWERSVNFARSLEAMFK